MFGCIVKLDVVAEMVFLVVVDAVGLRRRPPLRRRRLRRRGRLGRLHGRPRGLGRRAHFARLVALDFVLLAVLDFVFPVVVDFLRRAVGRGFGAGTGSAGASGAGSEAGLVVPKGTSSAWLRRWPGCRFTCIRLYLRTCGAL